MKYAYLLKCLVGQVQQVQVCHGSCVPKYLAIDFFPNRVDVFEEQVQLWDLFIMQNIHGTHESYDLNPS